MRKTLYYFASFLSSTLGLLLLWDANVAAQNPPFGQAQYAVGTLLVVHPDGIEDRLRGRGAVNLFENDLVRTEPGSRGLIDLGDGVRIGLNENTTLQLLSRWEKANGVSRIVRLKKGQIWIKGPASGKTLEIETASGTVILPNAEVDFKAGEDGQSVLTVVQGTVQFATSYGWCSVVASTSSSAALGRGCSPNAKANIQQILAWSRELLR